MKYEEYPDDDIVYNYDDTDALSNLYHVNYLTEEYVAYVDQLKSMTYGRGDPVVLDIQKSYAAPMNMLTLNAAGKAVAVTTTQQSMMGETSLFQELLSNKDFIDTQYDLLGGTYPQEYDEIALVVDKYNRLSLSAVKALGFNEGADSYDFDTLIGKEYKLILNDAYYTRTDDGGFAVLDESAYADVYADTDNTITLTLTGILRIKEEAPLPLYSSGLVYLPSLTEVYLEDCAQSEIGLAQKAESEYVYRALIPESYIENFPYAEVIAAMKLLPSFSGMSDEQLRAVIEEILDADKADSRRHRRVLGQLRHDARFGSGQGARLAGGGRERSSRRDLHLSAELRIQSGHNAAPRRVERERRRDAEGRSRADPVHRCGQYAVVHHGTARGHHLVRAHCVCRRVARRVVHHDRHHHVRVGHRAHQGDRRAAQHRRTKKGHHPRIQRRNDSHRLYRRRDRRSHRLCPHLPGVGHHKIARQRHGHHVHGGIKPRCTRCSSSPSASCSPSCPD